VSALPRTYDGALDVRITDSTLRDGSHAVGHRFTEQQVRDVVRGLDAAGVPVIEVSHGDGLGGSSYVYGRSGTDERQLVAAAVEEATSAKIAALLLPGVGTVDDIRAVADVGASVLRVATHCTEADIAAQHFGLARDLGLETVGFLMLAHRIPPEQLAAQARVMVDAGCECVYVTDSAGALVLDEVTDRVAALLTEVGDDAQVGFHGHQNLSLAVANTAFAFRAGAVQVDGCTRGLGAGAGNTPTEALVAVCDRLGLRTGVDVTAMMALAEDVVRPVMDVECVVDRLSLAMGIGGVYSSFMRHAARAGATYGVDPATVLLRAGERGLVGGQEDQLVQIALELQAEAGQGAGRGAGTDAGPVSPRSRAAAHG
jgi:4-hydroxy 2-oxovalerate aldolase